MNQQQTTSLVFLECTHCDWQGTKDQLETKDYETNWTISFCPTCQQTAFTYLSYHADLKKLNPQNILNLQYVEGNEVLDLNLCEEILLGDGSDIGCELVENVNLTYSEIQFKKKALLMIHKDIDKINKVKAYSGSKDVWWKDGEFVNQIIGV